MPELQPSSEIECLPRELMTIPLLRFRKIATLRVEFDEKSFFEYGILHQLIKIISDRKISILGMYSSYTPNLCGYTTFYLDITNTSTNVLNEIRNSIKSVNGVVNVEVYISPVEGLAIDPYVIPVAMGSRAIIIMKHSLRNLLKEIHKYRMELILNLIGREIGRAGFRDHERIIGVDVNLLLSVAENRFQLSGFGLWETVKMNLEENEFLIRIHHSIECEIGSEIEGYTGSNFIKGIIEGWFMELNGKDYVKVLETKCIAKGDQYCEFHIKYD